MPAPASKAVLLMIDVLITYQGALPLFQRPAPLSPSCAALLFLTVVWLITAIPEHTTPARLLRITDLSMVNVETAEIPEPLSRIVEFLTVVEPPWFTIAI